MKPDSTLLREFIVYVKRRHPDWSESEIARKTDLSQGLINKIVLGGGGQRRPALETYQRLCGGLYLEWQGFLTTNTARAREIAEAFGWVQPAFSSVLARPTQNPEVAEATELIGDLLSRGSDEARHVLLNMLRSLATQEPASSASKREASRRSQKRGRRRLAS